MVEGRLKIAGSAWLLGCPFNVKRRPPFWIGTSIVSSLDDDESL